MSEPIENPVALESTWACLAFTKRQWDLINVALIKLQQEMSDSMIAEVFNPGDFNYVYKWTKAVGSRP